MKNKYLRTAFFVFIVLCATYNGHKWGYLVHLGDTVRSEMKYAPEFPASTKDMDFLREAWVPYSFPGPWESWVGALLSGSVMLGLLRLESLRRK